MFAPGKLVADGPREAADTGIDGPRQQAKQLRQEKSEAAILPTP